MVRALRIVALPLLLLATGSLLPAELHWNSTRTLVESAIPDVVYLSHAAFGLVQGHAPYQSHFLTSPDQALPYFYPPLSLLLTVPPVLAGRSYDFAFSVELLLAVVLGTVILGKWARLHGGPAHLPLLLATLLFSFGPITFARVDGVLGLLVAGSALALTARRPTLAIALVACAVLIKETAILAAVPVGLWVLLPDPVASRPLSLRLRQFTVGLLPAFLLLLWFLVWSRGGLITSSLDSVHRAMEIESLPASVAMALSHFVPIHTYSGKLGSSEVMAADASAIALAMSLVGGLLLVTSAWAFASHRRQPATAIACAVAVGLCATPVLSPQYLLDLVPVLAVAASMELPRTLAARVLPMTLALGLLTQAEFPYLFPEIVKFEPAGISVLVGRNVLLATVAALLLWQVPWGSLRFIPKWFGSSARTVATNSADGTP